MNKHCTLTTIIASHVVGYSEKQKRYYPSLLDTGEAAPGALCLVLGPHVKRGVEKLEKIQPKSPKG